MATNTVLQSMKDELTCPLCIKIYNNPRLLSCHHTVCLDCYVVKYSDNDKVTCPMCSTITDMEPSLLQENKTIKSFLEIYQSHQSTTRIQKSNNDNLEENAIGYCQIAGCLEKSTNINVINGLGACKKHHDIGKQHFEQQLKTVRSTLTSRIGKNGTLMTSISNINTAVKEIDKSLNGSVEELHAVIKNVKLKIEELQVNADNANIGLKNQLIGLEDERSKLTEKEQELNELMDNDDLVNGYRVVKILETMLQDSDVLNVCTAVGLKMEPDLSNVCKEFRNKLGSCCLIPVKVNNVNKQSNKKSIGFKTLSQVNCKHIVRCVSICTNTKNLYHNPNIIDCRHPKVDMTGCVVGSNESDGCLPLPDTVIVCSTAVRSDQLLVCDLSCQVVSLVNLKQIPYLNTGYVYFYTCDSVNQSIFIRHSNPDRIHRIKMTGQVMSQIVDFKPDVYSLTYNNNDSMSQIVDFTPGVISLTYNNNDSMTDCGRLIIHTNPTGHHKLKNPSKVVNKTRQGRIFMYNVTPTSCNQQWKSSNIECVDAAASYHNIYCLSAYSKSISIYLCDNKEQLKSIQLNQSIISDNILLVEICHIRDDSSVIISTDVGRLYMVTTSTGDIQLLDQSEINYDIELDRNTNWFNRLTYSSSTLVSCDGTGKKMFVTNLD